MALGRGRGRNRLLLEHISDEPVRRPFKPPSSEENRKSGPTLQLRNDLFSGPTEDAVVYCALRDFFSLKHLDVETLASLFAETLTENMFFEARNSDLIAKYTYLMATNPEIGSVIKKKLFCKLQEHFKVLNDIRKTKGVIQYRNFVYFLISMGHFCRPRTIAPFDDILEAELSIAETLANSKEEEDIKLLSVIVVRCFSYIDMKDSKGVSLKSYVLPRLLKLVVLLRKKIAERELSNKSVNWLLLTLDLEARRFDDLPPPIKAYYENELGDDVSKFSDENGKFFIPKSDIRKYSINDHKEYVNLI